MHFIGIPSSIRLNLNICPVDNLSTDCWQNILSKKFDKNNTLSSGVIVVELTETLYTLLPIYYLLNISDRCYQMQAVKSTNVKAKAITEKIISKKRLFYHFHG